MNESTSIEATPRANACKYCGDPKVAHRFLSDDAGSTIEAEYRDGNGSTSREFTLGHAWDDAWWPCPAAGNEVRVIVLTPDSYDALQQRNRELVEALNNLLDHPRWLLGYSGEARRKELEVLLKGG